MYEVCISDTILYSIIIQDRFKQVLHAQTVPVELQEILVKGLFLGMVQLKLENKAPKSVVERHRWKFVRSQ